MNGEQRMRVHTGDMIFRIGAVLEHFSRWMPFEPGDLIAMGAPAGVAVGQPNADELYLKPGDVVEVAIEGFAPIAYPHHRRATDMSKITRGDPPNLKNVRSNIYHHYIRVDNPTSLIFLSGQLSRDADGKLVGPGDMAEQTRQAIRNMQTVLEAAGGSLANIVSIVVYTTDIRQFKEIVAARMEFFKDHLPTSTIVEVNHLADPGLLIEFQATAAL